MVVDLRSGWWAVYLFSLEGLKRMDLLKEKAIFDGEVLVGASHISFQFDMVTDILILPL